MTMGIEVGYATPERQVCISLSMPAGSTVQDAIIQSHILNQFPEIDLTRQKVGIFSKIVSLSQIVCDGDRVEIYRPLSVDPKQARQLRVKKLRSACLKSTHAGS